MKKRTKECKYLLIIDISFCALLILFFMMTASHAGNVGKIKKITCPDLSLGRFEIDDPVFKILAQDPTLVCANYRVYENRHLSKGRVLDLFVVVAPALESKKKADPIFFFAGGPGQGAAEMAVFYLRRWKEARKIRDLVFIDTRGTGFSHPLSCDEVSNEAPIDQQLRQLYDIEQLRKCYEKNAKKADLTQYTTANIVDDVDDIRVALKYDKINLQGASYASRAGLEYIRRHGQYVRSAYLSSFAPSFHRIGGSFAKDLDIGIKHMLADCANDMACNKAYPDLEGTLKGVYEKLKESPLTTEYNNPVTRKTERVTITQGMFFHYLRAMLADMKDAAKVPWIIDQASKNNFSQLIEDGISNVRLLQRAISWGLYWSVICAEDMPYLDIERAYDEAVHSYLGTGDLRAHTQTCAYWPRGNIPQNTPEPVNSLVPMLLLSGGQDPDTSVRWGEMVSFFLPNSKHVIMRNASHGVSDGWNECVLPMVLKFYNAGKADGVDAQCINTIPRPEFYIPKH